MKRVETGFYFALLVVVMVLFAYLLKANLSALVLAASLALVFDPLYVKVKKKIANESASALFIVAIVFLLVFVPLGVFLMRVISDATSLVGGLSLRGSADPAYSISKLLRGHTGNPLFALAAKNIDQILQQGLDWFVQNLGMFFSGLAQGFSTLVLSLLGLFYFLKDGPRLMAWVVRTIPLEVRYTRAILSELANVMSSVIKGTVLVALVQGMAAAVGFSLFNIPDPMFWGLIVVLTSPIPLVGAWLVITPAIAYLFVTGHNLDAALLLLWSVVFVNVIYNVVAPVLMHNGNDIHPYIILLSIIGGIVMFGPIGFLVGPLVAAFLFALLNIYPSLIDRQITE